MGAFSSSVRSRLLALNGLLRHRPGYLEWILAKLGQRPSSPLPAQTALLDYLTPTPTPICLVEYGARILLKHRAFRGRPPAIVPFSAVAGAAPSSCTVWSTQTPSNPSTCNPASMSYSAHTPFLSQGYPPAQAQGGGVQAPQCTQFNGTTLTHALP